MNSVHRMLVVAGLTLIVVAAARGQEQPAGHQTIRFDFATATDDWEMTDPDAWKFEDGQLQLAVKQGKYEPAVRSPRHIAWLKGKTFGSFQLDVKVLSTEKDYNHRDVCLFFGRQNASQFYYVHLGKRADPHANQIFIVNNEPRTKISETTTTGTPWDDQWHHVRIIRDITSGEIQVFFDDMKTPAMTATDRTFGDGRVGLGSFDDTASFDDLVIIPK